MKRILSTLFTVLVTIAHSYAESTNNDCYWYSRCVEIQYDENGKLINETAKYVYPTDKDNLFEIRFDYKQDFENSSLPFSIYLSEITADGVRTDEKLIGTLVASVESTIEIKDESINLFFFDYQVTIKSDGTIILIKAKNTQFVSAKLFKPTEIDKEIYEVRYTVLKNKIRKIQAK